ncbi:MAG TPA: DUF4157 domain-containing protein [Bacteroidetes bacterium]|nr:DUF4157 domain-containing protein [Bacteroidota bacterium]
MEQISGVDMGDVTVARNSDKPAQMNAHAYAQGNEIHLGPGQEKHLPHEAWHVVQQKEGRVKPSTTVNGSPVNDDKSLESEADSMGGKAMQLKTDKKQPTQLKSGYSLNTTQLKSAVVQRVAIETHGGAWDTSKYSLVTGGGGKRGADIELDFSPAENVDATKIGLIQTAKATNNKKVSYIGDPTRKTHGVDAANAIEIDSATKETDEGTHIDQLGQFDNPLYATGDTGKTNLEDSPTVPGWGQHGWRYKDATGKEKKQDAKLKDTPQQSGVAKDSKNVFEVSALALTGTQKGAYYGSIQWGWETDSAGNHKKLPLKAISQGVPSSSFLKAGEKWNNGKTSGGTDTIDIPLVDVKLAVRPITDNLPPDFIGPPLQIPTGTRVKILKDGGAIGESKIEVVDGIFTGQVLTIKPADLLSLKDERS